MNHGADAFYTRSVRGGLLCGKVSLFTKNGVDGSRTHVQKPIPCPSTIIVSYLFSLRYPKADILIPSVASSYARMREA